jgi:hypothetical protein
MSSLLAVRDVDSIVSSGANVLSRGSAGSASIVMSSPGASRFLDDWEPLLESELRR